MPAAHPLPKKHLNTIRDALGDLKCLAQRLDGLLDRLESGSRPVPEALKGTLQAFQADCYAVALRLSELEFADSCDHCPCAPAHISAEMQLALLRQKLRCLCDEMGPNHQRDAWQNHLNHDAIN
jgi:hypothetical protein